MRRWLRGLSAVLVFATGGCTSLTGPAPSSDGSDESTSPAVVLRVGEERRVGDTFTLRFDRVVEDSRCPVDVTCFWAGNAEVVLSLRAGTGRYSRVTLNTTLEPRSAERLGLRVTLVEVLPERLVSTPIPEEDYRIRLAVEPAV